MFTRPHLNSGIPIYVQLKEQIMHAIEKGALKKNDQLPSVRTLAEQLVINPNTVIKIYRELEMEGIIEIRHGSGAFVTSTGFDKSKSNKIRQGTTAIEKIVDQLLNKGLHPDEIRRILEAILQQKEKK